MICGQAVLSLFCEKFDLPIKTTIKLTSGLTGGIGLSGNMCGAACAVVMVLGLAYGPEEARDRRAAFNVFGKAQEFLARFGEIHGTKICSEITGVDDMADPSVPQYFDENPEIKKRCAACVQGAATILEDMLSKPEPN